MAKSEEERRAAYRGLFQRVGDLEAEIMGDQKTGRPSLRAEMAHRLDAQDKSLAFIKRVAMGVLITLIGYVLVTGASSLLSHPQKAQEPTAQGK